MPTATPTYDPDRLITATGQPLRSIARRLNIDPAILCRPLTTTQADRYAILLGLHPGTVWGADWWRPRKSNTSTQ